MSICLPGMRMKIRKIRKRKIKKDKTLTELIVGITFFRCGCTDYNIDCISE